LRKEANIPLLELCLPASEDTLPHDIRAFLREADRRIRRFRADFRVPGFVQSDYPRVYQALRSLADAATGNHLCEWGSGFGVVTCLAAMLGFEACGIEIEEELVEAARRLAEDFELPVEFIRDSFIPRGSERCLEVVERFAWLTSTAGSVREDEGLGPEDFDVIFAYPWPDEEDVIGALFERNAGTGALLLTYHGHDDMRLRRKVRRRPRHSGRRRRPDLRS
jgi:predicted O-methyltransferase YrrM